MLDKNGLSRKDDSLYFPRQGRIFLVADLYQHDLQAEANVPVMLRRPVGFPGVIIGVMLCLASNREVGAQVVAAAPASAAETVSQRQPVVTAIGVMKSGSGTQIIVSGDSDLAYESSVIEGRSLTIDIPGATSTVWPADQQMDDDFISRIQVAAYSGVKRGVRVVLSLKKPDGFTVKGENAKVIVQFTAQKDGGGGSALKPALNRVAEVTATRIANAFRVAVKTDAKPSYRVLETDDPRKLTIAIDGARLEPSSRKASDYSSLDTPVNRISASSDPNDATAVLIAIELRQPVPYRAFTDAYGLNVDLSSAASESGNAAARPVLPAVASSQGNPSGIAPLSVMEPPNTAKAYSGRKITLDFLDADLMDIFRLIADVSEMNIVANDDVKGRRSVKMTDVPWDQALEVILMTNVPPLVSITEGPGFLRITTKKAVDDAAAERAKSLLARQEELRKQEESLLKLAESRRDEAEKDREYVALNGPMVTRTFKLSYIDKVDSVVNLFKGIASQRVPLKDPPDVVKNSRGNILQRDGYIRSDPRTLTILVRDLEPNVNEMASLLAKIDLPTPAVLVEARIVEVTSDTSESFGVQWGSKFSADAAHGNATRFAFPNSVNAFGTQADGGLVNLPATEPVAGLGINFGHVANIFNLDLQIAAMERLNKGKLLSSPRIMVVDNKEAFIEFGDALAVNSRLTTTDTKTGAVTITESTEFKSIPLKLIVTPHVTNDRTVFMDINVKNDRRGQTVVGFNGNTVTNIVKREAQTSVLVGDGETTVIGGIFIEAGNDDKSGVPGFSKLPFVGWLFKNKNTSVLRREMIIFLTPKIVSATTGNASVSQ